MVDCNAHTTLFLPCITPLLTYRYDIKKQELDLITASTRQIATQLEDAENNYAKAQSTESDRQGQIKALKARYEAAVAEQTAAEKELAAIESEVAPLQETVRSKRSRVEEAKSTASSARSQSKVFQTLMALNRPGV
jgi:chromosome segregation ATPase